MNSLIISAVLAATPFTPSSALIATEVIRAGDLVTHDNARSEDGDLSEDDKAMFGKQVRRTVYVGKAVTASNTHAPYLVKRNQAVTVKYLSGGLEITLSGRAMESAAAGDSVTIMNTSSRELINGTVTSEGWVLAQ